MAKTPKAGTWVTTTEVAQAVGVSEVTIRRWAQRGVLPAYEVHHGGGRAYDSWARIKVSQYLQRE